METVSIKIKNIASKAISIIGVIDSNKTILDLEEDLKSVKEMLDKQSVDMIMEAEQSMCVQSITLDQNCIPSIEESIQNIEGKSIPAKSLESIKSISTSIDLSLSVLERELRSEHASSLNMATANESTHEEFLNEMRRTNTRALLLLGGVDLKKEMLELFISNDSRALTKEKDKIISTVLTYVDSALRAYSNHIQEINKLISCMDDVDNFLIACDVARKVTSQYPNKQALLSKSPSELYEIVIDRIKKEDFLNA